MELKEEVDLLVKQEIARMEAETRQLLRAARLVPLFVIAALLLLWAASWWETWFLTQMGYK